VLGALRILVVERDPPVADAVVVALEPLGRVTLSTHPAEALEWLARAPPFDVIVCELRMPYLSGPEFYVRARRAHPPTAGRILFLSGELNDAEMAFTRSIPNLLVSRPIRASELRDLVARVGAMSALP
jgi:two-component system, cell cycle sensor histidine kinase and response regulator CckA